MTYMKSAAESAFSHSTRSSNEGFNEHKMFALFSRSPEARALNGKMARLGFHYAGDTLSKSKANTDFSQKSIRINKTLGSDEAALSFAYELRNASQYSDFSKTLALLRGPATPKAADQYARGILEKEANSVLMRSHVAVAIGKEALIKNKRYNEIAADLTLSPKEKQRETFTEMLQNGKVHQGTIGAYDHYVNQFWEYNPRQPIVA